MMKYSISPNIDKNKVFLVRRSELEGRIEPDFYLPINKKLSDKLKSKLFFTLKELVKFSSETWNQKDNFKNTFPYIEISEIDLETGKINLIKDIPVSEAPSRAKMVIRKEDIIISTTRPTRGAISFLSNYEDTYIASTGFCVIRELKNNFYSKKALFHVLRMPFVLQQMGQRSSGGNYPAITQEELGKIIIPKISKETQQQIITLYETAYNEKQQKEQEAKSLLESIDDYLLSELGIDLPERDNSFSNRIFKVNWSEVSGDRFDAKLHDNFTNTLKSSIRENSYQSNNLKLKNIVLQSFAGSWGEDELNYSKDENFKKCLIIRATEFDNKYNLNFNNSRVKFRLIPRKKIEALDLQANDLLIEKSGGSPDQPVGRISILTDEIMNNYPLCFSNFIQKIRVDTESCNPTYLFNFLKTIHNIKLTEAMQSQTNGIRNLIMSNYLNQIIPLPPLEKQNEIAQHITSIREKAKQLELEATSVLKEAKSKIEKMIIG